jgi:hypothetical protein
MKKILVLFIFTLTIIGSSPILVEAQAPFVPCDGLECNACHLVEMGNTILVWLIGILFVVFAVILAVAGWGLVTSAGNQTALNDAKSKFTNAFIGLFIVLAAWLIVDTIMRGLLTTVGPTGPVQQGTIAGFGPWSQVECIEPDSVKWVETSVEPPGAVDATYGYVDPVTGFITTTPTGDPSVAGAGLTDAQVKVLLDGAGIEYKDSVGGDGLKQHVIDELINLNAACSCDITVTSLTDGTHASGEFSHANGFKADIRSVGGGDPNPELIAYVESLPSAGTWSNPEKTPLYYDADSCATYAVEGDHIDVAYKTGC